MKKKNRKRAIILTCIAALITLAVIQSNTNFMNFNIPYLPVEESKPLSISLFDGSVSRDASAQEKRQIVSWLNSIKRYEKNRFITHSPGGKPSSESNIEINFDDNSSIYILKANVERTVIIGRPFADIGTEYTINQANLYNLLNHM